MPRLAIVLALLAMLAVPSVANAQQVTGGLNGEQFFTSGFFTEGIGGWPNNGHMAQNCDENGTSTVRFRVTGVATGPYPGPFTETGTLTIGPQTLEQGNVVGTQRAGPVLTFTAQFTIESGTTRVTGTKTLSATFNGQQWNSVGACASFSNSVLLGVLNRTVYATVSGRSYMASVSSTYEATINTATGTIHDTGYALTHFNETYLTGGTCAPTNPYPSCQIAGSAASNPFSESFVSVVLAPECSDGRDNDGDLRVDYPADPGCESSADDSESPDPALVPAIVAVTPPTALNPVGTQHTVTATATTATGTPVPNVDIEFTVIGASDAQGSCTTNAQGQCTFTYTGPQLPGADLITGCADNDDSGTIGAGEPCGEATKIWILPVATPGQVTGGGWLVKPGSEGRVSFGFNAQNENSMLKGNCNVIDHTTKTQIKCLTVDTLVVTGTHATFFGQARVDGMLTNYRIDVDDLGEPGVLDTFKIQTDSGYTAGGLLVGGNIQIHQ